MLNRLLPGFSWAGMAEHIGALIGRLGAEGAAAQRVSPGEWLGEIHVEDGPIPIRLDLDDEGRARFRVESDSRGIEGEEESETRFSGGVLFARFRANVPQPDTSRAPYWTHLELSPRGDHLTGPVYAESEGVNVVYRRKDGNFGLLEPEL